MKKRSVFSCTTESSKGQVTIFMIVGILLLLTTVLIFFFQSETFGFKPGELFLTERGKVENYILGCLEEVANEGLLKLGSQGGYVELPLGIERDELSRLNMGLLIPYWATGLQEKI